MTPAIFFQNTGDNRHESPRRRNITMTHPTPTAADTCFKVWPLTTRKAWNMAERAGELAPGTRLDVAFQLEEDAHSAARGYPPWAAMLKDFRPA